MPFGDSKWWTLIILDVAMGKKRWLLKTKIFKKSPEQALRLELLEEVAMEKVIYESNSDGVVIEMTASLVEFVFQSNFRIAEDRIG